MLIPYKGTSDKMPVGNLFEDIHAEPFRSFSPGYFRVSGWGTHTYSHNASRIGGVQETSI